jgi:hypothetical protein
MMKGLLHNGCLPVIDVTDLTVACRDKPVFWDIDFSVPLDSARCGDDGPLWRARLVPPPWSA